MQDVPTLRILSPAAKQLACPRALLVQEDEEMMFVWLDTDSKFHCHHFPAHHARKRGCGLRSVMSQGLRRPTKIGLPPGKCKSSRIVHIETDSGNLREERVPMWLKRSWHCVFTHCPVNLVKVV